MEGNVALITGGSSGIGLAAGHAFARRGARVVVAARNVERGEEAAHEIVQSGGSAIFVAADVGSADQVKALVARAVSEYGRLDYAFNNAGSEPHQFLRVGEFDEEEFDRLIRINLKGVWLCMKYELAQMLAQSPTGGAIVNTSSIAGLDGGNFIWAALLWFLVFLLFPFFNKDAMRAGDVIAGTWVVEAPKTKLADALSTQGAAVHASSAITGAKYEFGEEELSVYGEHELQTLERMLREAQPEALAAVHATICRKIGWDPGAGDERAFLEAFYAQLRAKLETDMRFGKRKADKNS